jgi:hypothetical protein
MLRGLIDELEIFTTMSKAFPISNFNMTDLDISLFKYDELLPAFVSPLGTFSIRFSTGNFSIRF